MESVAQIILLKNNNDGPSLYCINLNRSLTCSVSSIIFFTEN